MTSVGSSSTWWRAAFVLAVVANLVILFWPRPAGPAGVPGLDKVVHVATFAALAFTGLRVGLAARWWLPLLAVHAVTSELVQDRLLSRRSGDPLDVLADLVGVLAGTLLARASWGSDRSRPGGDADRAPARGDPGAG